MDDTRTLEALRLLLNFESDSEPALTLLLVGHPALLPQIDRMPAFEERLGVKCLLRPFNVDETAGYMNFRMQAAGAKKQIFEPAAMEALHELSHGLPRQINRLCDLALLVGYAEERQSHRGRASRGRVSGTRDRHAGISCHRAIRPKRRHVHARQFAANQSAHHHGRPDKDTEPAQ